MRRSRWPALLLLALACGCQATETVGSQSVGATPPSSSAATPITATPSSTATATRTPTTTPVALPAGVPANYPRDSEPGDVPLKALVPNDASVTGSWFADPSAGSSTILVSYSEGADPFQRTNGLVEWVRFAARPFWRATYAIAYPPASGVLGIAVQLGDVTGDGSTDALVLASTGGSGGCGIWGVLDISASVKVFERTLCDATIMISTKPVGLVLRQAIFRPTDPHCCPSQTRVSVLTWNGGSWSIVSQKTTSASPS